MNDRHMYNYDYYYIYKAWITLSDFSEHVDMISMDTPPLAQSAYFFFWYELAWLGLQIYDSLIRRRYLAATGGVFGPFEGVVIVSSMI